MNNERISQPLEIIKVNNSAHVALFTLLASIIGGALAFGTVAAVIYHPLWAVIAGAAFCGAVVLHWRIVEHDKRAFSRRIYQRFDATETQPETVIQAVVSENGGQHQTYGLFKLTPEQWRAIAVQVKRNGWRVSRDIVKPAGAFKNIKGGGVWPGIKKEFQRLGILDGDNLTDKGRDFFASFLPPSPDQESARRSPIWRAAGGGGDGGGLLNGAGRHE